MPESEGIERVIIIGSGCAGLTAAIYAARSNLRPLLFEGIQPGGQLTITTAVDNYPGFPEGVQGPELMDLIRKQALRFGTRIRSEIVSAVDLSVRPFVVRVREESLCAHALIVSTGAESKWLGIPSEERLKGHGISTCATCDGFFYKDQDMVVVGGGDTAMEESLFLSRIGRSVTVVHRRDKLRASKIMQEKAFANPRIHFVWDSVVEEVLDPERGDVEGVRVRNIKTGENSLIACRGLFVAIGHEPKTKLFSGQLEMDELGYLRTTHGSRTSVEGVFAAGDVQDHVYRQAITAAGSGCQAAIDAGRWLEERGLG